MSVSPHSEGRGGLHSAVWPNAWAMKTERTSAAFILGISVGYWLIGPSSFVFIYNTRQNITSALESQRKHSIKLFVTYLKQVRTFIVLHDIHYIVWIAPILLKYTINQILKYINIQHQQFIISEKVHNPKPCHRLWQFPYLFNIHFHTYYFFSNRLFSSSSRDRSNQVKAAVCVINVLVVLINKLIITYIYNI